MKDHVIGVKEMLKNSVDISLGDSRNTELLTQKA